MCDPDIDNDGLFKNIARNTTLKYFVILTGISNAQDLCPLVASKANLDSDKDKVGDVCDNCPTKSNPVGKKTKVQADADADGIGDACESALDSDGYNP